MPTRKLPDPIIVVRRGAVTASTGLITIGPTTYGFPKTDGLPGQVLVTNGTGQLAWQPAATATSTAFTTPTLFQSSINFKPTDVYSAYAVDVNDNFVRYRGTAAATITLPGAGTVRQLVIENQSDAAVTVKASGEDAIDGDTGTITLDTRFMSASLMSDGLGNWLLI